MALSDKPASTLLPLPYYGVERAAKLLGCESADIYTWANTGSIELAICVERYCLAEIIQGDDESWERGPSIFGFSNDNEDQWPKVKKFSVWAEAEKERNCSENEIWLKGFWSVDIGRFRETGYIYAWPYKGHGSWKTPEVIVRIPFGALFSEENEALLAEELVAALLVMQPEAEYLYQGINGKIQLSNVFNNPMDNAAKSSQSVALDKMLPSRLGEVSKSVIIGVMAHKLAKLGGSRYYKLAGLNCSSIAKDVNKYALDEMGLCSESYFGSNVEREISKGVQEALNLMSEKSRA
ncbi:hypothetical protein JYB88_09745 [Shewanella cyperi]|uniref:Uncharacterized protein n=1 Tax=Shewanella cyperi TaxID=2814292 RepID=A0A974XHQ0_9GAMM|nr:hypothetical protein [Shewanella cyperi]QSX28585.1 hypothetical protein JYB88_09745 [Shewanella cyperi]